MQLKATSTNEFKISQQLRCYKNKKRSEKVPNIFRKSVFDELLVLILVEAHEYGEVPRLRSRLEVENHLLSPLLSLTRVSILSLPFPSLLNLRLKYT